MKCAYCKREIGTTYTTLSGEMTNLHIGKKGQIEKCYIERKFPMNLIFVKRNFKGIGAQFISNPITFGK